MGQTKAFDYYKSEYRGYIDISFPRLFPFQELLLQYIKCKQRHRLNPSYNDAEAMKTVYIYLSLPSSFLKLLPGMCELLRKRMGFNLTIEGKKTGI